LNILQSIDTSIFYFINVTLANPVTDAIMPFITVEKHWYVFYAIMGLYLLLGMGKKGKVVAILAILLVVITDQASSHFIKDFVQRTRPCHVLQGVHLLVGCTDSFSFPSSHAVNNFAAAFFFAHFYPKMKYAFYTGAFAMAISRVFCGVHYPSDILGGIIIGLLIGWGFIVLWEKINSRLKLT
jgi:undecaprenyl-diphosphatase